MTRATLAVVALALASGGCFTSWVTMQATGNARYLEEGAREETVPQPGVRELLRVSLPLARAPVDASGEPRPFALACTSTQTGHDTVHRSAYRYGKGWKKGTALMFLLEGAVAAAFYFSAAADDDSGDPMRASAAPGKRLAAALFAVDAVGTAALFFVPRKEVFRTETRPAVTAFRDDCPAGLLLEIAGETFPVDAAGRIGELGEGALDAYMRAPAGAVRVIFASGSTDVAIGAAEQCTWRRAREPGAACMSAIASPTLAAFATLEVPMGTLTRVE